MWDYVRVLWKHKFKVALITFGLTVLAFLFAATRPPTFRAEARLLLEERKLPTRSLMNEFAFLGKAPASTAEIAIMKSRKILSAIAGAPGENDYGEGVGLRLDQVNNDLDSFGPWETIVRSLLREPDPQGSLTVQVVAADREPFGTSLHLHFPAPDIVEISFYRWWNRNLQTFAFEPNDILEYQGVSLQLNSEGDLTGRSFLFHWRDQEEALEALKENLQISETEHESGVLKLVYSDRDPQRAADVLNQLAETYLVHSQNRQGRKAGITVRFIESEFARINRELENAEQTLLDFQTNSGVVALSQEVSVLIERLSELDLERARLGLQIHAQQTQLTLIDANENVLQQVSGSGAVDPMVQGLFNTLVSARAQAEALALEYTEEWPELIRVRKLIIETRSQLAEILSGKVAALRQQDDSLQTLLDGYRAELQDLPQTQRDFARFQRQARSYEQIYAMLLTQLQEAKIQEAFTESAAEIIDAAVPPRRRVSPNFGLALMFGAFLGFLLGAVWAFYLETTQRPISTAAQWEAAADIRVLGVIPVKRKPPVWGHGKKRVSIVSATKPNSRHAEAYRNLRAEIRVLAKTQTITTLGITSAFPGERKAEVAMNLAWMLAQVEQKVLLIDADLTNPRLHQFTGQSPHPGFQEWVLGAQDQRLSDYVQETSLPNLTLLPAGQSDLHPHDFYTAPRLLECLAASREEYDWILMNLPPVARNAEVTVFASELDTNLLVCKSHGEAERKLVQVARHLRQNDVPLLGSVLTQTQSPSLPWRNRIS